MSHKRAKQRDIKALCDSDGDWFSGYLGSTGLDSGIINQKVNGLSQVEFYMEAEMENHILIKRADIMISATTHKNNNFGNATELTNGISLYYSRGNGNVYQLQNTKTNAQILLQAGIPDSFDQNNEIRKLDTHKPGYDMLVITINYDKYMGGGLLLTASAEDRIASVINDNLAIITDSKLESLEVRLMGLRMENN